MIPQAAASQQGRAPLIANAVALMASSAGAQLPAPVRETIAALIATALDPHGLDGLALRHAVEVSGTFQEASLLKAAGAALADRPGGLGAADIRGDAKAVMLALREALQPLAVGQQSASPHQTPPPLPQKGHVGAGQPPASATIGDDATPVEAAKVMLAGTEGALDRLRLLQAASIPDRAPATVEQSAGRADRLVEIPIALPGGQAPIMSLALGRDGRSAGAAGEAPAWRMRLSLDLPETGPIQAMVALRGERAGVTLWAERPATAELFRSSLDELRDALTLAEIDIDTLDVRDGAPPQQQPARAGSFLDLSS
jgi:hypothetical protein